MVIPIVVIVGLVVVNGVFVAAEFSLVGARRSRLATLADGGSRAARWLVGVFDRPTGKDGYIAVAQLGITLASIGLGMYGEPAVAGWLYGPFEAVGLSSAAAHTVGFIVAFSAITYMHVVFGEMIPKALALQTPERVSLRVNPVMRAFGLVFRPMVAVLNAAALALMRLLRIPEPDHRLALYTSAELAIVTDEAADSGQLGAMQRDLIRNIFDLDERQRGGAHDLRSRWRRSTSRRRRPRSPHGSRRRPAAATPSSTAILDHVIGVLHIKDFIRAGSRALPLRPERSSGRSRGCRRRRPGSSSWSVQARPDARQPGGRRVRRAPWLRHARRHHRRGDGRRGRLVAYHRFECGGRMSGGSTGTPGERGVLSSPNDAQRPRYFDARRRHRGEGCWPGRSLSYDRSIVSSETEICGRNDRSIWIVSMAAVKGAER